VKERFSTHGHQQSRQPCSFSSHTDRPLHNIHCGWFFSTLLPCAASSTVAQTGIASLITCFTPRSSKYRFSKGFTCSSSPLTLPNLRIWPSYLMSQEYRYLSSSVARLSNKSATRASTTGHTRAHITFRRPAMNSSVSASSSIPQLGSKAIH